jgi:hypothetical protein
LRKSAFAQISLSVSCCTKAPSYSPSVLPKDLSCCTAYSAPTRNHTLTFSTATAWSFFASRLACVVSVLQAAAKLLRASGKNPFRGISTLAELHAIFIASSHLPQPPAIRGFTPALDFCLHKTASALPRLSFRIDLLSFLISDAYNLDQRCFDLPSFCTYR